jgi:hypothetical protein
LKLRVCRHPNPLRKRGIATSRFTNVSVNPSLTRRVVMIPLVFAPLIFLSLEQRNFKTYASGWDRTVRYFSFAVFTRL